MNPHCFIEPAITPSQPAREVQRQSRIWPRVLAVVLWIAATGIGGYLVAKGIANVAYEVVQAQ